MSDGSRKRIRNVLGGQSRVSGVCRTGSLFANTGVKDAHLHSFKFEDLEAMSIIILYMLITHNNRTKHQLTAAGNAFFA